MEEILNAKIKNTETRITAGWKAVNNAIAANDIVSAKERVESVKSMMDRLEFLELFQHEILFLEDTEYVDKVVTKAIADIEYHYDEDDIHTNYAKPKKMDGPITLNVKDLSYRTLIAIQGDIRRMRDAE